MKQRRHMLVKWWIFIWEDQNRHPFYRGSFGLPHHIPLISMTWFLHS